VRGPRESLLGVVRNREDDVVTAERPRWAVRLQADTSMVNQEAKKQNE